MRLFTFGAVLFTICLILFTSSDVYAEPPCHIPVQKIIAPQRIYPQAIHAATIFHDTHLHIVEVPVPALVFQTLSSYATTQPQVVQPAQPSPPAPPIAEGMGTDDTLAALLAGPAPQGEQLGPLGEIRQKCASCHSQERGSSKGGLSLFNQAGQFAPTTTKSQTLTRAMIAARARSTGDDVMPPAAAKDASKRLSEAALVYLEQGQ